MSSVEEWLDGHNFSVVARFASFVDVFVPSIAWHGFREPYTVCTFWNPSIMNSTFDIRPNLLGLRSVQDFTSYRIAVDIYPSYRMPNHAAPFRWDFRKVYGADVLMSSRDAVQFRNSAEESGNGIGTLSPKQLN
jgi:hypothetical protein